MDGIRLVVSRVSEGVELVFHTSDMGLVINALMGFKSGCLVSCEFDSNEPCYRAVIKVECIGNQCLGLVHNLPEGSIITLSREDVLMAVSKKSVGK